MKINKTLQVLYKDRLVGTLALTKDGKAAFEYDEKWLVEGFSISPFSFLLEKMVYIRKKIIFMDYLVCLQIAFPMPGEIFF